MKLKLFYYDSKHQQVIAKTNLRELSEEDIVLINNIIGFLENNLIIDGRYKNLTLAEDIRTVCVDGETELVIKNAR